MDPFNAHTNNGPGEHDHALAGHFHHFHPSEGAGSPSFTFHSTSSPGLGRKNGSSPGRPPRSQMSPQQPPQQPGPPHSSHANVSMESSAVPISAAPSPSFTAPAAASLLNNFQVHKRALPSTEVTDENFADAYTTFIFYCNPGISINAETKELQQNFRSPPKCDGKAFDTWRLWGLIKKLEAKEIKTWAQLALDLGVDPPEAGQSTQKVQQYSVRLKRWMRAMHIDAFFEFLLGKKHAYYTRLPPPGPIDLTSRRDGVPVEEDLAIKSLDPSVKPKRGRKKAEVQDDFSYGGNPRKRPRIDTSVGSSEDDFLTPFSAYPASAFPFSAHSFGAEMDPWAVAAAATPSSIAGHTNANVYPHSAHPFKWPLAPSTPHPMSAVTPTNRHRPPDSVFDEPRSAITPSTSKPKSKSRRNPVVSSAWPSNNGQTNGKVRGRPPNNRQVRDGPFVTFPANPRPGATIETTTLREELESAAKRSPLEPSAPSSGTKNASDAPGPARAHAPPSGPLSGRPGKLHLHVPQNFGKPIRQVTPTLLVNGESNASESNARRFDSPTPSQNSLSGGQLGLQPAQPKPPSHSSIVEANLNGNLAEDNGEAPKISPSTTTLGSLANSLAANLQQARVIGKDGLTDAETHSLAQAILQRMTSGGEQQSLPADQLQSTASAWLGLNRAHDPNPLSFDNGLKIITVHRSEVHDRNVGMLLSKELYDVSWTLRLGGLRGDFTLRDLELVRPADDPVEQGADATAQGNEHGDTTEEDDADADADAELDDHANGEQQGEGDYRSMYLAMKAQLEESQAQMQLIRDKVLGAVMPSS